MRWIQEHVFEGELVLFVLLIEKAALGSRVGESLEKRLNVSQHGHRRDVSFGLYLFGFASRLLRFGVSGVAFHFSRELAFLKVTHQLVEIDLVHSFAGHQMTNIYNPL